MRPIDDKPAWHKALDLLAFGEDTAARNLLAGKEVPGDGPADRWSAGLLLTMLTTGATGVVSSGSPSLEGRSEPGDMVAQQVGRGIQSGMAALQALRERRIADLVSLARSTASCIPPEHAWLGLRSASLLQAAFRFTGERTLLEEAVQACSRVADRIDAPIMAVQARALLGNLYLLTGHYPKASDHCDAAITLAAATGLGAHRSVAMAHQFRGYVLYEWNRLDEAHRELEKAWSLSNEESHGIRSGVARVMASATLAMDDTEASDMWLDRLERVVTEPMTLRNREWLAAVRIWHGQMRTGDRRALEQWQRRYDYDRNALEKLPDTTLATRLHEYHHLLVMLEATSQWRQLLETARIVRRGCGGTRVWFLAHTLTAEAVALEGLTRRREADRAWAESLSLGDTGSFVRLYLQGSPMRIGLLRRALNRSDTAGHARRIIDAAGEGILEEGDRPTLTYRHLEVLRLVAEGLSNRDIGRELSVAESTVKTHLREIYARLAVSSRTRAVAEGRNRGLL